MEAKGHATSRHMYRYAAFLYSGLIYWKLIQPCCQWRWRPTCPLTPSSSIDTASSNPPFILPNSELVMWFRQWIEDGIDGEWTFVYMGQKICWSLLQTPVSGRTRPCSTPTRTVSTLNFYHTAHVSSRVDPCCSRHQDGLTRTRHGWQPYTRWVLHCSGWTWTYS